MNILIVCDDNLRESVVYDIHLLAESLSLRGHQVVLVGSARGARSCLRTQSSPMQRVYPDSTALFYQFPYLRVPGLNWLLGSIASYFLLRRLTREYAIEHILMYSVLFTGIPALRIAAQQRIPTSFRSIDLLHQLFRNPLKRRLVKALETYVYRRVTHLFALSDDYRKYLTAMDAAPEKISVLSFPVNTEFFREAGDLDALRQQWGIAVTDFTAVYMGHLYPFSALPDILRAIPALLNTVPNFKLVVVGGGPQLAELEALRHTLKLESHAVLTGLQPFDFMPKFLGIAQVCLNAYTLNEQMASLFSAKIIQYMAAEKPVISLTQPGMSNSLKNEEHGVIFVDSIAAMMKNISDFALHKKNTHMLAQKNLQFVQRFHAIKAVTTALETMLLGQAAA